MQTTLDPETQRDIDLRNELSQIAKRSEDQQRQLISINDKLSRLGFMFEDREPLYQNFLQSLREVRYADRPPLTPDQIEKRRRGMTVILKELLAKKGGES